LQYFPDRNFRQPDIDRYNRQVAFEYERIRDFIIVHYNRTERAGEFWHYCRSMQLPDSLKERLELFSSYGRIIVDKDELFTPQSWLYLLIGQAVQPSGYDPLADRLSPQVAQKALDEIRAVVGRCAASMPSHQDFIAQNCAAPPG
jgi:tryptophan halogenase